MYVSMLVLQRGWVVVGEADDSASASGGAVILKNAQCVRVWGTKRGLGEIAAGGPTTSTILDPLGNIIIPNASVIFAIICNTDSWTKHLIAA